MPAINLRLGAFSAALALLAATSSGALAQKKYDIGATDTEIKIGNIMPYSGPASAYGVIGKTEAAYFNKINAEGGINGRKINFITYDDAYSPPKTVEQARKLVESDEVLFIFNSLGTPPNSAIQKYMNTKKVPQLFVATGATKWNDPKEFPWTMGWQPNYQSESQIYAKYILKNHPNAKIAVLYQNDDYGKDYLKGFKDGLGAKAASMIVMEESYEISEPTIDSHIVKLKSTGADVFFNITTPKFAAQAIKKNAEIGWKPLHFLNNVSASIGSVIKPAGFENAQDIISSNYLEGSDRPAMEERRGHEGLERVPGQILSGSQPRRRLGDVRLYRRPGPRACAEGLRRRPDPREHHEAGGQHQGSRTRRPAARRQGQHLSDRLRPDLATATDEVQGRDLGAVRRHHERRRRRLRPVNARMTTKEAAPAALPQGLFVVTSRAKWYSRPRQVKRAFGQESHDAHIHIIERGRNVMPVIANRLAIASAAFALFAASSSGALAQKKYDTGATDTEIKIGNIMPYSGPASAYGVIGKTEAAYFKKINDAGGINGRKINFISYDDAYSPPKTVEQARKLVESDEVLLDLQLARHAAELGDPQIHELEEGAAAVRRHRRHQVERSEEFPVDHGLAAQLPERNRRSTRSTS